MSMVIISSEEQARDYPPRLYAKIESRDINTNFRMKEFPQIRESIGLDAWEETKKVPIGIISKLVDSQFVWSGKVVHFLLCNQLRVHKKELWFVVGGQPIRFGLNEFHFLTGLNIDPMPTERFELEEEHKDFFRLLKVPGGAGPTLLELREALRVCRGWVNLDHHKWLGLLLLQHIGLYGLHHNSRIPYESAKRVFDDEAMKTYPWGRSAFEALVDSIKMLNPTGKSYTLSGFTPVLQAWAYESIKCFGERFGNASANDGGIPMLQWGGNRTRSSLETAIAEEIKALGELRVINMVMKENDCKLFHSWSEEEDDPAIDRLIEDIHLNTFVKGFWDVKGSDKKKKKKKAEAVVESESPPAKKRKVQKMKVSNSQETSEGVAQERKKKGKKVSEEEDDLYELISKLYTRFDTVDRNIENVSANLEKKMDERIETRLGSFETDLKQMKELVLSKSTTDQTLKMGQELNNLGHGQELQTSKGPPKVLEKNSLTSPKKSPDAKKPADTKTGPSTRRNAKELETSEKAKELEAGEPEKNSLTSPKKSPAAKKPADTKTGPSTRRNAKELEASEKAKELEAGEKEKNYLTSPDAKKSPATKRPADTKRRPSTRRNVKELEAVEEAKELEAAEKAKEVAALKKPKEVAAAKQAKEVAAAGGRGGGRGTRTGRGTGRGRGRGRAPTNPTAAVVAVGVKPLKFVLPGGSEAGAEAGAEDITDEYFAEADSLEPESEDDEEEKIRLDRIKALRLESVKLSADGSALNTQQDHPSWIFPNIGDNGLTCMRKNCSPGPGIYDPLAPVDPVKVQKLLEYLKKAENIPLGKGGMEIEFYRVLITKRKDWPERPDEYGKYGWCTDEHLGAFMRVLRCRYKRDPFPFHNKRIAFIDPWFTSEMVHRHYPLFKSEPKFFTMTGNCYEELVKGLIPSDEQTNLKWIEDVDHLYITPQIGGNHWVALHVDLNRRHIDCYDSIVGQVTGESELRMLNACRAFTRMIRAMMNANVPHEIRTPTYKQFTFRRRTVSKVPQNVQSGDCCVYALKFIECLALGVSFDGICDQNIQGICVKMAAEIFDESPDFMNQFT